jgi:phage terminase large subunit-like protein
MKPTAHRKLKRWQSSPIEFIETVLHDPESGAPFVLLPAERDFLAHAFQTDDDGRLLYPELVFGAPKKSGKTGFAALFVLTMVLLFGEHFAEGYALANDFEQAQSRVFQAIRRIVEASPLLMREAKITADKITFPVFHHAMISVVASDYAGAAGANPTISCFDELWAYTSERARRLWDEMVPPPTRKIACRLTTTYAGFSGESTLLEELFKRGMALPQIAPNLYAGDGLLMFWSHEPVAPWQTEKWLADMRWSLRRNQFLRMIENRFVTSESSFIDLADWDACVDELARPVVADKNLPIWIGVDASVKHDNTAIVAVTFTEGRVRLVSHRVFVPTPNQNIDFELAIEATLVDLSRRFAVRQILFDPYQMQATAQRLQKRGLPIIEFPQSVPNLTLASQNLYELITGRNLVMYPDQPMRLAASRAIAIETSRGWKIAKEKTSHRIDTIVALGMACHAAVKAQNGFADAVICAPFVAEGVPRNVPGGSVLAGGEVAAPFVGAVPQSADPSILRHTSLNNSGLVPEHYYKANQPRAPWADFVSEHGIRAPNFRPFV